MIETKCTYELKTIKYSIFKYKWTEQCDSSEGEAGNVFGVATHFRV